MNAFVLIRLFHCWSGTYFEVIMEIRGLVLTWDMFSCFRSSFQKCSLFSYTLLGNQVNWWSCIQRLNWKNEDKTPPKTKTNKKTWYCHTINSVSKNSVSVFLDCEITLVNVWISLLFKFFGIWMQPEWAYEKCEKKSIHPHIF